jgi:cytochrome c peroxidase
VRVSLDESAEPEVVLPAADPHAVIAIAVASDGTMLMQSREPAAIAVGGSWIDLADTSVADTGHAIFHRATPAGISCASCHPEGSDDGHAWTFEGIGTRRTPPLDIGIIGTEPFHWDGDIANLDALMAEVYVRRMSGNRPTQEHVASVSAWVATLAPPPRPAATDAAAVERGRALFHHGDVGCATCHRGPRYMRSGSIDVGTGGAFQVPSLLGLANRPGYMHNGCASSLTERFGPACGGGEAHGQTAHLSQAQIGDLVAFLRVL